MPWIYLVLIAVVLVVGLGVLLLNRRRSAAPSVPPAAPPAPSSPVPAPSPTRPLLARSIGSVTAAMEILIPILIVLVLIFGFGVIAVNRVRSRRGVDASLERHCQRLQRFGIGAPRAGRRHHAGAQFADHLLADVRVIRDLRDVERRER